jgi:hypothetical protein
MDCDELHLTPNEKMEPIQWTEWPTGALVAAGSLWPIVDKANWVVSRPVIKSNSDIYIGQK